MKKLLLFFLTMILCLSALMGCSSPDNQESVSDIINRSPNMDTTVFSHFLDNENFVHRVSQGSFIEQMEKYIHDGTPITELVEGYHYDGAYGGGYRAGGKLFGFRNEFAVKDKVAKYSNQFWTKVQLDGLELPYGIKLNDSLSDAFQKIGITINPYNGFSADENSYTDMTFYRDDKVTFVFKDLKRTQEPVEYEMPYVLIYSEVYNIELSDGRPATVERTIKMSFGDNDAPQDDALGLVEISVDEIYSSK